MRPQSRDEFEIAIICALPLEFDAVEALFDERYDNFRSTYGQRQGDGSWYRTRRVCGQNVVLACMPRVGKGSAASVASSLRVSFVKVKLAIVVGICGGVPFLPGGTELILGDIIVSDSIVEYDFGRQYPDGYRQKGGPKDSLRGTNRDVQSLLSGLKTHRMHNQLRGEVVDLRCCYCGFMHQGLLGVYGLDWFRLWVILWLMVVTGFA